MSIQLVISHYEQELDWAYQHKDRIAPIIYDKSSKDSNLTKLPNVGREPHTYMHHIVENYDSLAEWTIFTQDDPFVHINNWSSVLSGNENDWRTLCDFSYEGGYFFSNMGLVHCDQAGLPHHPGLPILQVWNSIFNSECPTLLQFTPGCHLILHRDLITTKPKAFYKNIKNVLQTVEMSPWVLERIMIYVFDKNFMDYNLGVRLV